MNALSSSGRRATPPRLAVRRGAQGLLLLAFGLLLSGCQLQPPVSIGQRESKIGQGMIVLVTNTSDKPLQEVRIRIEAPAEDGVVGEAREHFEATLGPRQVLEVGWLKLDGWPIPQGAKVNVTVKGYALGAKANL